jgi:hypothetical protein
MNKFEYYCCWLDVFNAQALQEFLDEKGSQGWEVIHTVPERQFVNYNTLFILKRRAVEVIEIDKY